jgi:GNAT superfamily N-acetyltransferase
VVSDDGVGVRRGSRHGPTASATSAPALRLATPDDIDACIDVWRRALDDYLLRLNQPAILTDLGPIRRLLGHLLATDRERFWVATRREGDDARARVVGFASANVRGTAWFLAMLFIEPAEQARGLGSALLERTLPPGHRPGARTVDGGWTFATVADSVQPVSNGLYARIGLVPRVPVLHLAGYVERPSAFPSLPEGVVGTRFEHEPDLVVAIDREVVGYERPADHAFLRREERTGILYTAADGSPVGYGYTSRGGRVGPVAARDGSLLPAILGHLLSAVRPNGAYSTWVPGAAGDAVRVLLEAGLRLEPFPALHCWDRPSVDVARYLPITLALL